MCSTSYGFRGSPVVALMFVYTVGKYIKYTSAMQSINGASLKEHRGQHSIVYMEAWEHNVAEYTAPRL